MPAGTPCASTELDLVLHQRQQGRDDHGDAVQVLRGKLIDQRFAAAGGQHGQHVAAGQQGADHALLPGAEAVEPELLAQGARMSLWLMAGGMGKSFPEPAANNGVRPGPPPLT